MQQGSCHVLLSHGVGYQDAIDLSVCQAYLSILMPDMVVTCPMTWAVL